MALEYTHFGIKNHPLMNGEYIRFIISQRGEQKSYGDFEHTVNKQESELETLKHKFDGPIGKVSYIKSTADKANNSAEESNKLVKNTKSSAAVYFRCSNSESFARTPVEFSEA